jgi:hypothetical protein
MGRCENLLVLMHFDFFGTTEELEGIDDSMKKACEKTDGVAYLGRFGPRCKKYHWTRLFKVDHLNAFDAIWSNIDYIKDPKIMGHAEEEFYNGPFDI